MRLDPAIIEHTRMGRAPRQPLDNGQRLQQFRQKLDSARQEFNQFFSGGTLRSTHQQKETTQ